MVDEGAAALRDGDTAAARRAFELALAEGESGEALEGLAKALYLEREYAAAAAHCERTYVAYRRERRPAAAGRAAMTASWITGNVLGDWAVRNGWLARARAVLEEAGPDGPEHGWVLLITAWTEPDAPLREAPLREAVAVGRRLGDADIEFEALSYLGGLLVMTDRVEEGLVLFDEGLATACAGELTELTIVDSIFCGFFWACELVNDVPRADQWMRAAAELMRRRNVVAAFCRAHYGGILTAAGRWTQAETELLAAARHFDRGMSERREAGGIRLGELRVRQGRLEEAARLLEGLDHHPDAVRARAGLLSPAARWRSRATCWSGPPRPPTARSPPWASRAWSARCWRCWSTSTWRGRRRCRRPGRRAPGPPRRRAARPLPQGRRRARQGTRRIAAGEGDARACLNDALEGFARAQLPLERARARLELARALADRSPEVAVAEAKAALEDFERLEAARHADAAAALLRSLGAPVHTGPKGIGALTRREAEVLRLIGAGLSNPEIADRLYITRKTVEHHVGNVLAKLGLRNRAEAAAYATRRKISP